LREGGQESEERGEARKAEGEGLAERVKWAVRWPGKKLERRFGI